MSNPAGTGLCYWNQPPWPPYVTVEALEFRLVEMPGLESEDDNGNR